jgi:putative nucleotidyltransferase with HDIG domain
VIAASKIDVRHRLEEEVPPFRHAAVQLLHLTGDPTVSTGNIVNLLRTDPVLTMGLLRVANSPLFAPRHEITDVRQAVAYLGLDLVRSLAVTAAMRGLVDTRPNPLALPFWRHSLATALTCRKMCGRANISPELAYTAGLLHDVGQLGLMRLFPDYAQTVGGAVQRGESLTAGEAQAFGIDHCQVGRWLLSRWRLPLELQNVAAGHESPSSKATGAEALTVLAHAGSLAAEFMGFAVIPPAREIEPRDIADAFPDGRRQGLLESLPDVVEWVRLNVDGIEMSL